MPLAGIRHPVTLETISLADAPDMLEEEGILPREITHLLIQDSAEHAPSAYPSPSVSDPTTACRRQQLIERFLPYVLEPASVWAAKEGIIWHDVFAQIGAGEGWLNEVWLPADPRHHSWKEEQGSDLDHPRVKECEDGKLRVEVWPSVWMRCRVDRAGLDWSIITDHKTKRASKKDWGLSDDWCNKLWVYARIVEILRGVKPKCRVWRMYRGGYEPTKAWRCFDAIPEPSEEMQDRIKVYVTLMARDLQVVSTMETEEEKRAYIRELPLEGLEHFQGRDGSNQCTKWCAVSDVCGSIQGSVQF